MQTDGLYRVLRALASLGIFAESSPRAFALTPAAELLRKGPGSLGDGIEFITDPLHFETYAKPCTPCRPDSRLAKRWSACRSSFNELAQNVQKQEPRREAGVLVNATACLRSVAG